VGIEKLSEDASRRTAELEALFASVADGLLVMDPQGRVLRMNPTGERMLNLSPEDRQSPLESRIKNVLHIETADGRPYPIEEHPGFRALRGEIVRNVIMKVHPPHGRVFWVSVSAAPVKAEGGAFLGAVMSFTDITALHDLQEGREDMLRAISHDLRNPLTAIMGLSSLLWKSLDKKELQADAEAAESITRNARRMNSMIQDLVDSVRLDAGVFELHRERTEVSALLSGLDEVVGTADYQSRLRIECPEGLPPINADRERLERAILNLVSNGLKYSPTDCPVWVKVKRRDGKLTISVVDQGAGINSEDRKHLFERFYRTATGRKAGGLGLGLFIVKQIVEAHGGQLRVDSEVGKGSTFSIEIPIDPHT